MHWSIPFPFPWCIEFPLFDVFALTNGVAIKYNSQEPNPLAEYEGGAERECRFSGEIDWAHIGESARWHVRESINRYKHTHVPSTKYLGPVGNLSRERGGWNRTHITWAPLLVGHIRKHPRTNTCHRTSFFSWERKEELQKRMQIHMIVNFEIHLLNYYFLLLLLPYFLRKLTCNPFRKNIYLPFARVPLTFFCATLRKRNWQNAVALLVRLAKAECNSKSPLRREARLLNSPCIICARRSALCMSASPWYKEAEHNFLSLQAERDAIWICSLCSARCHQINVFL